MYSYILIIIRLLYNYIGDRMNAKESVVVVINSFSDIAKLNKNTLYVNISSNASMEVIDYFLDNGSEYYYADVIGDVAGYIYVDYDTFYKANMIIKKIISFVDKDFSKLEIARYLYIKIAKFVSYDINSTDSLSTSFCKHYLQSSNIWSALSSGLGNNVSYVKLFYYLCAMFDIEAKIVCLGSSGYLGNKVVICDDDLSGAFLTDLTKDVPYIQAGFKTHYFGSYNENVMLDKRIKYIDDVYIDDAVDRCCSEDVDTLTLLSNTSRVINLKDMGQVELGIVYRNILKKYKAMDLISVNNLYINNKDKIPFVLITDNDKHYSYNYKANSFVSLETDFLLNGIDNDEIGIYSNEEVPGINCDKESIKVA